MPPRSPFARSLLLVCTLMWGLSASFAAAPPSATGQGVGPTGDQASPGTGTATPPLKTAVSLEATAVAVPADGAFSYDAKITLARPAPYLQARLRIRRPSGRLLYQKTYVKSDLPAGPVVITFSRSLADLDLRADTYPAELTVIAEDNPPNSFKAQGTLRVYDPAAKPLRMALLVRVSSPPSVDTEGRFVTDPGVETHARDEVGSLADAILRETRLRAAIAIAPELLQEWKSISSGYTYAGSAGLKKVAASETVPLAYGMALRQLARAVATGRLELLDVPYADPNVAGLSSTRRETDLGVQYRLGAAAYAASLATTPSAGTFTAAGCLTSGAAQEAAAHGVKYALVGTRYLRGAQESVPAGVYVSPGVPLTVLVPDAQLGRALGSDTTTSAADAVFKSSIAAQGAAPARPVVVEVGPGRASTVRDLLDRIAPLVGQSWVSFVTPKAATQAAKDKPDLTLIKNVNPASSTPSGWWSSNSAARRYADALASVLGPEDPDGAAAVSDSLIAQSAAWAGPDGKWALADRGRSFSSAAQRLAQGILDSVSVSARDLTLSGSGGSVPFSITNDSGRSLKVVLRLTTQRLTLRSQPLQEQTLLPAENYITVPVELRASSQGQLRLQVVAGTLVIASTAVTVHASYLDRLAIVGAVTVVLGVMLFYIRRRVSSTGEDETADNVNSPASVSVARDHDDAPGAGAGQGW